MRSCAILLLLLASYLFYGPAEAMPAHGSTGSTATTCPMGTGLGDGCTGASPTAQVIYPALLTTAPTHGWVSDAGARQSYQMGPGGTNTQAYAATPTWNLPGVNYPVGITQAQASLADPLQPPGCTGSACSLVTAVSNAGCNYYSSGWPGTSDPGWHIRCWGPASGSVPLTLAGYDFSLHGCLPVYITPGSNITTVNLTDDYFGSGPNCTQEGNGSNYLVDIAIPVGQSTATNITNVTVDGKALTTGLCAASGNCTCYTAIPCDLIDDAIKIVTQNPVTITYSAFIHTPANPFAVTTPNNPTQAASVTVKNNLFYGYGYSNSVHTQSDDINWAPGTNLTMAVEDFEYNVDVQPANTYGNSTGAFVLGSLNTDPTGAVTVANVSHNVIIANIQDGSDTMCSGAVCGVGNLTVNHLVALSGDSYTYMNYTNNYFDPTGALDCIHHYTVQTMGPENFSGNVDMLTGAPITAIGSGSGTGCTGNHP